MSNPEEVMFPRRKERFEDRRKEGDQRKLADEFFDHRTLLAISALITQGQFEALDFPIMTGKEGGVFRASGAGGYRAVKVYRIGNTIFRNLPAYALEELRREASGANHARMIYGWTRREHTVLRRLAAAGVPCPEPYGYLRNILVMQFVGTDGLAAPRLQDVPIDDPERLYVDLLLLVRKLVYDAKLVHGDLSPYNILFHDGHPVLIDVAQSVPVEHPAARGLLVRDITHFARYLQKLGVDTSPERFQAAVDELPAAE
ncbi:MAG: serine protein kinase RIO [Thermoplasmata archaeon]|nr:serine protein kinase RIO [Thermoplasmata archaeon]